MGFPLANPHSVKSLHFVPDENIMHDSAELCIRRGNLKYFDRKIGDTNPKKSDSQICFRDSRNPQICRFDGIRFQIDISDTKILGNIKNRLEISQDFQLPNRNALCEQPSGNTD